ncbi:cytidine deaminase-like protein [Podospora conica]|nr:cytidine deaminase-like protein [Schizothecium conicum]
MFIGLCGGISNPPLQTAPFSQVPGAGAGKRTIAEYLKNTLDFTEVDLDPGYENLHWDDRRKRFTFDSADALLEHVTKHWRQRWVTTRISADVVDMYARRPFFLLVSVDAPVFTRWVRYETREGSPFPLKEFVQWSDDTLYNPQTGQLPFMSRASVHILNTSSSIAQLHTQLAALDLLHPDRLRPSWDMYFMSLASLAAQRSNCMKRRVGCVVVRDKRVISTGYNGTPRGLVNCGEGGCGRCNAGEGSGHGLATCLCIHAEENALLEAGRERLAERAVLYCDTCPCLTCSIKIVQVGIGEVVYSQEYSMDGRTAAVFAEGGVKLRQFVPPPNGLIHVERDLALQ